MIREILSGPDNRLSSKRLAGWGLIIAGSTFNALGMGDPNVNSGMIYAGVAALGVGVLETRVNKT
jgi:hypothetical protein